MCQSPSPEGTLPRTHSPCPGQLSLWDRITCELLVAVGGGEWVVLPDDKRGEE
jgi:hypothetical protein